MTTAPLKSRIIKATAWLIGGNVSSQMLRLISNLLLTRLLTPDAFGLVASVNTLYFGLVMFSDFGVWQSVVKSEDGTKPGSWGQPGPFSCYVVSCSARWCWRCRWACTSQRAWACSRRTPPTQTRACR